MQIVVFLGTEFWFGNPTIKGSCGRLSAPLKRLDCSRIAVWGSSLALGVDEGFSTEAGWEDTSRRISLGVCRLGARIRKKAHTDYELLRTPGIWLKDFTVQSHKMKILISFRDANTAIYKKSSEWNSRGVFGTI